MQEINRTYEQNIAVNAAGLYQIFSLELSPLAENHIILSVDTTAYDLLAGDTSIRHSVAGIYNDTARTVTPTSVYQSENKNFNQGDSDIQEIVHTQATGIVTQSINVSTTGARTIKVISFVKILAF